MKERNLDKWLSKYDIHIACNAGLFITRINRKLFIESGIEDNLIKYHDNIVESVLAYEGSMTNKYILELFFKSAQFLEGSGLSQKKVADILEVFKVYITHVLDNVKSNAKLKSGV